MLVTPFSSTRNNIGCAAPVAIIAKVPRVPLAALMSTRMGRIRSGLLFVQLPSARISASFRKNTFWQETENVVSGSGCIPTVTV